MAVKGFDCGRSLVASSCSSAERAMAALDWMRMWVCLGHVVVGWRKIGVPSLERIAVSSSCSRILVIKAHSRRNSSRQPAKRQSGEDQPIWSLYYHFFFFFFFFTLRCVTNESRERALFSPIRLAMSPASHMRRNAVESPLVLPFLKFSIAWGAYDVWI